MNDVQSVNKSNDSRQAISSMQPTSSQIPKTDIMGRAVGKTASSYMYVVGDSAFKMRLMKLQSYQLFHRFSSKIVQYPRTKYMAIPHSFYFMVCAVTWPLVVSRDSGLSGMSDSQLTVTNQFENRHQGILFTDRINYALSFASLQAQKPQLTAHISCIRESLRN